MHTILAALFFAAVAQYNVVWDSPSAGHPLIYVTTRLAETARLKT
jgi:hypothetical protein